MHQMAPALSRRTAILTLASSSAALIAAPAEPGPIETHLHLFAADTHRFPFSQTAPYQPKPLPLEQYVTFAKTAGIQHVVIVHPEPYQDDHRYLEYCLTHEPSPGFFKGTCLFDPLAPETPARMEALVKKYPGRLVALRIHEMHAPGTPSLRSGPIKDRDLRDPAMQTTWKKAQDLGIGIQMHFLPHYAPQIGELAARFPDTPVILDHLARIGQGTAADLPGVLQLARLPKVYMKCSGLSYSSKQPFPYKDVKPTVRKFFDAFGPDRLMWAGLGSNQKEFAQQRELFAQMFDFANEADRQKVAVLTARKLFHW